MRQKNDVKEEKRNVQNSLNNFLLYQVDRCFPLTADVQKVLFLFCSRSYLQTAVRVVLGLRVHSISGEVRLRAFCSPRFEGVSRRIAAADWMRVRSAPRAVRWAMTLLPGTAEIENNAGGESAKLKGELRSCFCFHKQDAKN